MFVNHFKPQDETHFPHKNRASLSFFRLPMSTSGTFCDYASARNKTTIKR